MAELAIAQVRHRWSLRYSDGADPAQDRPGHVRAGSGLALWRGQFAVVQDDALFVAQIGLNPLHVSALALPHGEGGVRQFGGDRPNKRHKPDLEAALALPDGRLLLLGSGSTPQRNHWYLLDPATHAARLWDASELYRLVAALPVVRTAELNLEGAALWQGRLWLAQRSNGKTLEGKDKADALVSVDQAELLRWLAGGPLPHPRLEMPLRLGSIRGVPLTVTDLCAAGERLWWLAAAEDSPDAYQDGEVCGSTLGWLDRSGVHRLTLTDEQGQPLRSKCEGLAVDPLRPGRCWAVVDADDAEVPAELLEIALPAA
jgi:hypothetical protein